MKNRLVAFGCSNTYGHGLEDCYVDGLPGRVPSALAWPTQLAEFMDKDVINMGQPGASNKRIWHNAFHFDYEPNDIAVFMWTYTTRYAILKKSHELINNDKLSKSVNLHINDETKASRNYFKQLYNSYDALQHLYLYASNLNSLGIKTYHIFTDYDYYDKDFYALVSESINWKHWGFHWPEHRVDVASDNVHNGPQSHKAWATKIFDWINE